MSHRHSTFSSDPDQRGMWMRQNLKAERFPTYVGESPVGLLEEELSIADDLTEEVTHPAPQQALVARPLSNRESATGNPAPRRLTRRPRPSPLFGEGELESQQYTLRETLYMGERQNTLWETDVTDPGRSTEPVGIHWSPPEESITLEVDEAWRQEIARIDDAWKNRENDGLNLMDLVDDWSVDDLCTEDLVLDTEDAHNLVQQQTQAPAPLSTPAPAIEAAALAMRAPSPVRTYSPGAPVPVESEPITLGRRVVHAAEALAWFTAGATLFGGTGAAVSLLTVAILFLS